ncbi:SAM-dependent methyltransferase [Streptomyces colonosanans]|uniref:S-adenosyl-L-methionine-dependent methyltransferase n=1 Tax=Streptomyces colonosanans TaxID=1428652 RepID=A0A1S2P8E2_9ACTN|nr:SAM-dependent methyltransferase [Streptomyces colonosanans]OIJ89725.1 hypothetical protein BIV24_19055 [Streptomyces colonosanans]
MTDALNPVERTALLTAALRAAETRRTDRLYEDPYAARLAGDAGPELLAEMRDATFPPDRPRTQPSAPDYNAIRTRFFDDFLLGAAQEPDMTQIVLAPAGMDSRAYRLNWPGHIRYFEVDRPAVLEFKADRLQDVTPQVARRRVAVDLTSDDWEKQLVDAGYDPSLPSTWLIEGLLHYIPEPGVRRLLERVAAISAPGSRIAADLVNAAALTLPHVQGQLDIFKAWGCPWVFGSDEPEALFDRCGFDVDATQPGEPGADFGRWPGPVPPPRTVKDTRRVFLMHGRRR